MSKLDEILDFIIGLKYEDIPATVTNALKKSILDTLAAAIAGSSEESCQRLVKMAKTWGGRREATILLNGRRAPLVTAALVNCTMSRVRELDEVHEDGGGHLSSTIIPSAFIISEYSARYKNIEVNGRDFMTAIAIGREVNARLRCSTWKRVGQGWLAETFAPISVAAIGGRILGFDRTKLLDAMGIAYSQCAGNSQAGVEGASTTFLQQGFAGSAGILSIILAEQGFTGAKDILEGQYGLCPLYMHVQDTPEELTADLGKLFISSEASIKPYPCCKYTHAAIFAVLELAKDHNIKADDVRKVTINTSSIANTLCGGDAKITPNSVNTAQMSYYYIIATALVKGKVFIENFTNESLHDKEVLTLAKKIDVVVNPEIEKLQKVISPVKVEIETNSGKHFVKYVDHVHGHPSNSMSIIECEQKFKDCARFSVRPIPESDIKAMNLLVRDLDEVEDITMLLNYLE